MSTPAPASVLAPKPHYAALDGLRGVAAVMVVLFHMFEGSASDFQFHMDQIINHGYLSVDFFFMLSGFVIGYAYDDRWEKMNLWNFCKRRLVRLQPMVVMGMLLGGILFYIQGSEIFPNLAQTPVWKMLLVMTVGFTLLPVPVSLDVRGWSEMHPLHGPALRFDNAVGHLQPRQLADQRPGVGSERDFVGRGPVAQRIAANRRPQ